MVVDHLLTSPMAQYNYWASNKAHFTEEPCSLAWSPLDLLVITLPETQEKLVTTGKEKEKETSSAQVFESSKQKHLGSKATTQGHSTNTKKDDHIKEKEVDEGRQKKERVTCNHVFSPQHFTRCGNYNALVYPSIESFPAIVPPPTLQRVKEKRRGCFIPTMQISNDAPTTQVVVLSLHEIDMLDTLPSKEQSTLTTGIQATHHPHVHLLRQMALVAKETPSLPLEVQTKLAHLEAKAKQKDQEISNNVDEIRRLKAIPAQPITIVQKQLASARDNVNKLKGQMMQSIDKASKEEQLPGPQLAKLIELHKYLGLCSPMSSLMSLSQKMSQIKMKLDHTTDKEGVAIMTETSPNPPGEDIGEQVLGTIATEEVCSSSLTKLVLAPPMGQSKEQLLGPAKEEAEAGPTQETLHPSEATHVEEASLYESSPSEANEAKCFKVVPPTATVATATSSSTPKGKRSKSKVAPLGAPARIHHMPNGCQKEEEAVTSSYPTPLMREL
eukprot:Gb_32345 [translate_table: standard]